MELEGNRNITDKRKLKIAFLLFENFIYNSEVYYFRAAIIEYTRRNIPLFHNHDFGTKSEIKYPLIQYKTVFKRAAIIGISDGAFLLQKHIPPTMNLLIGRRNLKFVQRELNIHNVTVEISPSWHYYSLLSYLPFNQENYMNYLQENNIPDKIQMVEVLIKNHIVSFIDGAGFRIDSPIDIELLEVVDEKKLLYKGIRFLAFDLKFRSNLLIPDFIGIGKGVSVGFGKIMRVKNF